MTRSQLQTPDWLEELKVIAHEYESAQAAFDTIKAKRVNMRGREYREALRRLTARSSEFQLRLKQRWPSLLSAAEQWAQVRAMADEFDVALMPHRELYPDCRCALCKVRLALLTAPPEST